MKGNTVPCLFHFSFSLHPPPQSPRLFSCHGFKYLHNHEAHQGIKTNSSGYHTRLLGDYIEMSPPIESQERQARFKCHFQVDTTASEDLFLWLEAAMWWGEGESSLMIMKHMLYNTSEIKVVSMIAHESESRNSRRSTGRWEDSEFTSD